MLLALPPARDCVCQAGRRVSFHFLYLLPLLCLLTRAPHQKQTIPVRLCTAGCFSLLFCSIHTISPVAFVPANAQHRARDTSGPRRYVPIRFIFISRGVGLVGGIVDRTTNTVPFPPARLYLLSPSVYCCCCLPLYAPLCAPLHTDGGRRLVQFGYPR